MRYLTAKSRLVPALLLGGALLAWIAFLWWYNAGGWLTDDSGCGEILGAAAVVGFAGLFAMARQRLAGDATGYPIAAAVLVLMAAYTSGETGVLAPGVLGLGGIALAIGGIRKGAPRPWLSVGALVLGTLVIGGWLLFAYGMWAGGELGF
ncbi:MAG: hypothetical protein U1E22_02550 [Coriobacteriia bacterium]|nr:hypothetical protein [Coriobacteriia bacterium]